MSPKIICILGMHRSGTSLVARLSNLLGVYLGPETHLVRPARDNPKGFWEHRGFLKINERLLARAGGSWRHVPQLARGWHLAADLENAKAQAEQMFRSEFGDRPLWGWKDPRTSLTLPFWQDLLEGLRYLICVRNPLAVAQSLVARDGLALQKGVELWLRYVSSALENTEARPRAIVVYERLLTDCRPELARLARLFDMPELAPGARALRDAESFIDPSLRHDGGAADDSEHPGLLLAVQAYEQLCRGDTNVRDSMDRALAALEPDLARLEREEYARWRHELDVVKAEIARVVPQNDSLILADDGQWAFSDEALGRRQFAFVERDGAYWGPPADDASAVAELQRLRSAGARFFALGAPSFWWLDHYRSFHGYLQAHARCVSNQPKLLVFELT